MYVRLCVQRACSRACVCIYVYCLFLVTIGIETGSTYAAYLPSYMIVPVTKLSAGLSSLMLVALSLRHHSATRSYQGRAMTREYVKSNAGPGVWHRDDAMRARTTTRHANNHQSGSLNLSPLCGIDHNRRVNRTIDHPLAQQSTFGTCYDECLVQADKLVVFFCQRMFPYKHDTHRRLSKQVRFGTCYRACVWK